MNVLIKKLIELEKDIADEKGDFWLFALLQREESPHWWDLAVAADWLRESSRASLEEMVKHVGNMLNEKEIVQLSRVVVLDPNNPVVQQLTSMYQQKHGYHCVENINVNGMDMDKAVIITSRQPEDDLVV
jgi:hypothetical protein